MEIEDRRKRRREGGGGGGREGGGREVVCYWWSTDIIFDGQNFEDSDHNCYNIVVNRLYFGILVSRQVSFH